MEAINFSSNTVAKKSDLKNNQTFLGKKQKQAQDTVDISNNQEEKQGFSQKLGTKNSKKFFISAGLTLLTVIGLGFLGNKMSNKTAHWGLKVDDFLKSQKWYNNITEKLSNGKKTFVNFIRKSKTIDDIFETLKNRKAKPTLDFARGYGRGWSSIFANTVSETIKTATRGLDQEGAEKLLKNILDDDTASTIAQKIKGTSGDNKELSNLITEGIKKRFNCKTKAELLQTLEDIQQGKHGKEFVDILMNGTETPKSFSQTFKEANGPIAKALTIIKAPFKAAWSFISNWGPVVTIEKAIKKIKPDAKFGRGNLGDALIKYNAVNGTLADTKLGSLTQKLITVPTESISNFVNDKSGFGVMLCASIMNLYNEAQDAPKDKRVGTIADDFVGTIGTIAISTPMAFATTYGLASLKNIKGDGIIAKGLKAIGNVFGIGLPTLKASGEVIPNSGALKGLKGLAGGTLRFFLTMMVFSNIFSKPIRSVIHKVFGKPYNKEEAQQQALQEAQAKEFEAQMGITQEEFMKKMQNNPKAIERLQKEPILQRQIATNPQILIDLLDNKTIKQPKPSPAIENMKRNQFNKNLNINRPMYNYQTTNYPPQSMNYYNQAMGFQPMYSMQPMNQQFYYNNSMNQMPNIDSLPAIDTATYIPTSDFSATGSALSPEETAKMNDVIAQADKAFLRAQKFL